MAFASRVSSAPRAPSAATRSSAPRASFPAFAALAASAVLGGLAQAAGCSLVTSLDSLTDGPVGGFGGAGGAGAGAGVSGGGSPAVTSVGGGGAGCPLGMADCDKDAEATCETDVTDDPSHCGSCSKVCAPAANSFPTCVSGVCDVGCNAGAANCDGDPKNGCETPTLADAANCGACERSCQGGACDQGDCLAVELTSNASGPYRMAVSPDHVYWTEGKSVKRVKKIGGFVDVVYSGTETFEGTWGVAANETHVFFTTSSPDAVHRANLDGSEHVAFAPNDRSPAGIAVDATHAYWVRYTSTESANPGVYRKALAGGAAELVAGDLGSPSALALDEASVYWVATGEGRVMSAPKGADQKPELLASGLKGPWSISVFGDHVYFTEDDNEFGRVGRVPKAGGAVEVLADNQRFPFTVIADASGVYWTAAFDDKVLRADHDGKNQRALARDLKTPEGLVTDDATVYFGELLGNSIKKVAK